MNKAPLSLKQIDLIAGTRALIGAGIGLLVAPRLSGSKRRAIGWSLLAVGALSTIPIALELFKAFRGKKAPAPVPASNGHHRRGAATRATHRREHVA